MKTACIILVVLAAGLSAEELLVRDLRLGVALAPTDFRYTSSDELASGSGGDAFDQAWAGGLRAAWSWSEAGRPWAPILACELVSERATYGSGGFSQFALRGLGGLGWQLSDDWSLSALALVGAGRPTFDVPVVTGGGLHLAGASAATGVLVGAQWAFSRAWAISVEAGWIEEASRLTGDGATVDMTRSGFSAGLGLVWSWSRRPVRLE